MYEKTEIYTAEDYAGVREIDEERRNALYDGLDELQEYVTRGNAIYQACSRIKAFLEDAAARKEDP